jgi:hypothetical protein
MKKINFLASVLTATSAAQIAYGLRQALQNR